MMQHREKSLNDTNPQCLEVCWRRPRPPHLPPPAVRWRTNTTTWETDTSWQCHETTFSCLICSLNLKVFNDPDNPDCLPASCAAVCVAVLSRQTVCPRVFSSCQQRPGQLNLDKLTRYHWCRNSSCYCIRTKRYHDPSTTTTTFIFWASGQKVSSYKL